ncbi:MAG: YhcN/YlaJ family sporulation lipoprotein [Bacillota bacterium]|nr:YhcN/YlaJ family sporulation lipoprotein [Thermoanaerobacteraceae bacterium]
MRRKILFSIVALMFAVGLFWAGGCTAPQRKPTPPASPTQPAPEPARKPLPTDPRELSRVAGRLAGEAARVPGVNKATVVIVGSTAYVGINLNADVERGETTRIRQRVADRVRKTEPRLRRVMVTADADTFTRIKRVQDGIARGKPVSAFTREIQEINRRMTPTTR